MDKPFIGSIFMQESINAIQNCMRDHFSGNAQSPVVQVIKFGNEQENMDLAMISIDLEKG